MKWSSLSSPFGRLLPGAVLTAGALALAGLTDGARWQRWEGGIAPAILGIGILLAWRFRCGRVVLAYLLLAIASPGLASRVDSLLAEPAASWHRLWGGLLPLSLSLIGLLEEAPLRSRRSGWRLAGLGLGAGLAAAALALPESRRFIAGIDLGQLPLAIGLVIAGVAFAWRRGAVEAGVLWAVLLAAPGVVILPQPLREVLLATLLAVSVLEAAFLLAWRDELTGLPSRRALESALRELAGCYTVAMVDIDHFKRVNDRHGHDVGDQVLRRVAAELRCTASAYRYGGEEFALLFPGCTAVEARPLLEAARQRVSRRSFVVRSRQRPRRRSRRGRSSLPGGRLRVTVSVGLADDASGTSSAEVLKAADRALYRAKRAGRNRVEGGAQRRRVARGSRKG